MIRSDGGTPYSWAGTAHATPESLHAATGQGGHDLLTDPKVTNSWTGALADCTAADPGACSPAVDSAWAEAPGALATDIDGRTPVDHPYVANLDSLTFAPGGRQWVGITFAVLSALTVVVTAAYILWTLQRVFMGTNPAYKNYPDITVWELCCAVPLVVLAVVLGVFPPLLFSWMEPSVTHLVDTLVSFRP